MMLVKSAAWSLLALGLLCGLLAIAIRSVTDSDEAVEAVLFSALILVCAASLYGLVAALRPELKTAQLYQGGIRRLISLSIIPASVVLSRLLLPAVLACLA